MKKDIIINGDALMELKKIPDESIDMIFADPPYWMRIDKNKRLIRTEGYEFNGVTDEWDNQFDTLEDYEKFTFNWLKEAKRILKKNGSIWVIGGMQCIYTIGAIMQKLGFWFINDVIWWKKNPTPNFRGTRLTNSHETLIWAVKSKESKYTFNYKTAKHLNTDTVSDFEYNNGIRKQLGSVWRIGIAQGNERLKDENGKKLHSTQKPEELLYRIIAISTKLGDLILDPFGGTMTTAAVAKKMGRHYIMIEKDEKYCKYGEKRLGCILPMIGDIEKAIFDKKEPRIYLKDLIKSKKLIVGEKLYFKKDKDKYVILTKDGKVDLLNGELLDMHSAAAKFINGKAHRLNGYKYWYVIRNNNMISIDEIRNEYKNSL
ncbi:site-specific DNA-methyltransferase [Marinitoga sp. 1138]|uniref:site-specific DNA-methyltransferase n=1 Tax=Marinitoga sp. 1138 TaxID=1643334 RepID=UPI0015865385|nr:modification methylase [Marinitoga sp. 1138]